MKKLLFTLLALLSMGQASAQSGGISPEMLREIRNACPATAETRALRNALAGTSINQLALAAENPALTDTYFSNEVPSKGVTDQKSSGRCWLFTGLNVFRARMIKKYELGKFEFSQSYCFFYDQLEKANLFLQATIDNAKKPMDDKTVEWLFKNPLSDGGTFCGVQDVVTKYGLVPAEVMPESFAANNTSRMSDLIALKLREYGLALRAAVAKGEKPAALQKRKTEMLTTVYRMLTICLGTPPAEFTWTRKDAYGKPVETKTYTIEYDRHSYDGCQWTYVNLPMDEIKPLAIASIKDSTMLYFSCDVGKCYNSKTGILSLGNYNYADLFGTDFPMNKADRIRTFASASSHAMTLMAVDLDAEGKPTKWKVENSWGPSAGYQGHIIMTDEWFDEYMFRLVVDKKYVPASVLDLLKQKPTVLPAWDPLFAEDK